MSARRAAMGVVCLATLVPALALAGGEAESRQSGKLKFTESTPGASSGTRLKIDYVNPDDPEGKPPAVRKVVLVLPRGARFDTGAPEQCTASDEELILQGAEACPEGSVVGSGVTTVDSGLPGPARFVTADITFLNNEHELIYVNTIRDSEARTIIRAPIKRRKIITEAPMLPGTPPDGGAIDTVKTFDPPLSRKVDGKRRSYLTLPRRCPADGTWTNRIRFTYSDGVKQIVRNDSRCFESFPDGSN